MFDPSVRRHPVQTFQFWFVVLTCFVTVTAWKLDLFSFPQPRLPIVSDEPMPPPPQGEPAEIAFAQAAPQQSPEENNLPALEEVPRLLADPASNSLAELQVESAHPAADAPLIRTASAEQMERPTAVIHTAAHQEIVPEAIVPLAPVETVDLAKADQLIDAGDEVTAHRLLSGWYWKLPEARPQLMERLNLLARRIYFLPEPHYIEPCSVQFGDRLDTVATKYHLSREYLMKLNRLQSPALRAGQSLKVIQGPFSAVVDVSDMELTVHSQGYYVARFKVGFGTDSSIPDGTFRITDKVLNPDYYSPRGTILHTDPENPLGSRWLAINDETRSLQGYGLHGTVEPALIGQIAGPGCLRLGQQDAEAIYDLLTIGSELIIHP